MTWPTPEGILQVNVDNATFELSNHFASEDEARRAVQPYLDAWEVSAGLSFPTRQRPFQFRFRFADILDRAVKSVDGMPTSRSLVVPQSVAIAESLTSFPMPPTAFAVDDDVRLMWQRWEAYKSGRETLPTVAYFCLTVLEASVGGSSRKHRVQAGQRYQIAVDVLNKLGDLASDFGADHEARKAHRPHRRSYTSSERSWIESALLRIIARMGEMVADPGKEYALISMDSLPSLPAFGSP